LGVDPQLQLDANGLWRPAGSSPAIDGGQGSYSGLLADDMDGQPRIGLFDVGADEFSAASIVRKPLEAGDVGPSWLQPPVDPPSGGGCFASGCAIQAEDFSSLLDPNNDGFVWTKSTVTKALGGEVLVAPNGDRTDLPTDPHDTIAVYDLTFQQPGTYRAYYRARGFNGGTDSIYVPDDFATDPDNSETLSSDGIFRWEVGSTFTITSANVDVPFEFRIGRREALAEFDALVLNLDLSLTPTELDALFAIEFAAGDFNEDGSVDAEDLLAWEAGFGMSLSATPGNGDADGDGDVDGNDFLTWQRDFSQNTGSLVAALPVPEPGLAGLLAAPCMVLLVLSGSRSRR